MAVKVKSGTNAGKGRLKLLSSKIKAGDDTWIFG